jgi:hypothetical protein
VAPPEVTIKDIYKGVPPFIVLQGITLALVFFYPQIALWRRRRSAGERAGATPLRVAEAVPARGAL